MDVFTGALDNAMSADTRKEYENKFRAIVDERGALYLYMMSFFMGMKMSELLADMSELKDI